MKRLNETELRNIIKGEIRSIRTSSRASVMTEARANMLVENMLNEIGLFAAITAGLKGMMAGLGGGAVKALEPVKKVASALKSAGSSAASAVTEFVGNIKDEAVKNAVEARNEAIQASVDAAVKKAAAEAIQDFMKLKGADGQPIFDETAAKSLVANLVMSAVYGFESRTGG